jgi:diguanylate cyclase (GGDEF)-like protein
MRLTREGFRGEAPLLGRKPPALAIVRLAVIVIGLLVTFGVDRATASAPLQHLYYLPIILASLWIGRVAGLTVSGASIVLYHIANPGLLSAGYKDSDVVQIVLFLAVGIVTSTLAENARHLHQLASTDDLTGLHNLRSFENALTNLVRTARMTGAPLSMLAIDVDRLKRINDAHGHLAGAEAVRTVGHVLAAHLPTTAVACRYGGDEFVVALPGYTAEKAAAVAQHLRRYVNGVAPFLAGVSFPATTLSISVGVACLEPRDFRSMQKIETAEAEMIGESLFKAADRALYVAKEEGRNRVSV